MTDWKLEEDRYLLPTYAKFPFVLERGEGCWVWDADGRRYLDLYGGHAVCILGHCPPPVVQALAEQAGTLMFYSNLAYTRTRAEAARALVHLNRREGAQVFFCNSGAEANESAMRVARLATGRKTIVATIGGFHGRTAGALAATGMDKYKKGVTGLGTDVVHVPFGDLAAADRALNADAAGFLLEPIQSMAGVILPPPGYLEGLDRLCRERGAVLIFDEVQTGLGRIGSPSAALAWGVHPGIQTFAKGLGSGVPIGAILVAPELGKKLKSGDLGSTFGGGPFACAAARATLETLDRERLWENALRVESLLRQALRFPQVKEVRGRGLLLGLIFDRPAKDVRDALLQRGILTGTSEDPAVLRLLPPLTMGAPEVEILRVALAETFAS